MKLAIDLISPVGHYKFNELYVAEHNIDIILSKRYHDYKINQKTFIGTKKQFGWIVRLERTLVFPIIILFNFRMILKSKEITFLNYDFYSEIFIIYLLSLLKNINVIHHGFTGSEKSFRIKTILMSHVFKRCSNSVMTYSFGSVLHNIGLTNVKFINHPVDQQTGRQTHSTRPIKFLLASRGDVQYYEMFDDFFRRSNMRGLTRKSVNLEVGLANILRKTEYFIMWEKYDYKVSGFVYEAISHGCKVIMRPCGFSETLIQQFPNAVKIVDRISDIEEI